MKTPLKFRSRNHIIQTLRDYPLYIKYINNPDKELQFLVIEISSEAIKYIDNPHPDAILLHKALWTL